MTITLPAILDHVPKGTEILKPSAGNKSLQHIAVTDNEASPRSRKLGVRKVCLTTRQATPFHVHIQKEKVYIYNRGDVIIIMEVNGIIVDKYPQQQGPIVVPAGVPHAILCPANAIGGVGQVYVITSDQEASDIYWEQNSDELVRTEVVA